jgi:hypothetical protein
MNVVIAIELFLILGCGCRIIQLLQENKELKDSLKH